jgi:hypothetical protein
MSALELKVYEILKARFSENEANQVLEFIDTKAQKTIEKQTNTFEKIVNKDIEIAKQEIRKEIADSKSDIIKWMFLFWIGQVAFTFGLIILFLNK